MFASLQSDVFSLKRHYGTIGFGVSFFCEPIIHTSIRETIPEEILCPTAKPIGLQSILLSVSHCFRPLGTLAASGMSQHQLERIHLDDPHQVRRISYLSRTFLFGPFVEHDLLRTWIECMLLGGDIGHDCKLSLFIEISFVKAESREGIS